MAGKSESIWIKNPNRRDSISSDGPFSPSSYRNYSPFGRSMSVASDGTAQNSPPNSFQNDPFESFGGRQRSRTQSFSGNVDDDSWSVPLSTSAPGAPSWRRSNSVSYAADKNLGRIDEHSSGMLSFGGFGQAIMKSREKLFSNTGMKQNFFGDSKRKNGQTNKDQVVSMLCDGSLR